jgi:uncharacterized cupredoxin-like copper-binding protein
MTLGTWVPGCTRAGYQRARKRRQVLKNGEGGPILPVVVSALHRSAAPIAGVLACIGLLAVSGCGGGSAPAAVRVIRITERDFHITAPRRLAPGRVRLEVTNDGPDLHELIVVRDPSSRLPMRADGLTVDEDALEPRKLGSLEPGAPGSVRGLTLQLRPGRYEIFCNMAGHYMSGMHVVLVVP